MGFEEAMKELDEKMKHDWRLRWYHRKEVIKLDISEWWIGFYRCLWKWLVCSWKHWDYRCYPQDPNGYWHCYKCHPCGEWLDHLDEDIKADEIRKRYREVVK